MCTINLAKKECCQMSGEMTARTGLNFWGRDSKFLNLIEKKMTFQMSNLFVCKFLETEIWVWVNNVTGKSE
jgi:hypothetical protein